MSEDRVKRRWRATKRTIVRKLREREYQVSTCDSGPFDIIADRPHSSRRIIIAIDYISEADIKRAESAIAPSGSRKEIWRVSPNGRSFKECHITKNSYSKMAVNGTYAEPKRRQYVYFLLNKTRGLVKVGRSLDTARRMRELSHNHSDVLEMLAEVESKDAMKAERAIHKALSRYRTYGEWFKFTDEVADYIKNLSTKVSVKP